MRYVNPSKGVRTAGGCAGRPACQGSGGAARRAARARWRRRRTAGRPTRPARRTFPRSFKIQRASSADSLASLVRPSLGLLTIPML